MKTYQRATRHFPLNYLRLCVCAAALVLLCGCLPYPHRTVRSPEIRGRVLDARTHEPIEGANVFLKYHTNIASRTDSFGCFHVKATHNFHLGVLPPEGHWPQRKYYGSHFIASHTNYFSGEVSAYPTNQGAVLLKPKN